MNELIGKKVMHKVFGTGTVIDVYGNRIDVCFNEETGELKTFQFPDSFKTYLTAEDENLQQYLIKLKLKKDDLEREKEEALKKAEQELRSAMILLNTKTHKPLERSNIRKEAAPRHTVTRKKNEFYSVAFKCTYCDGGSNANCIGFKGLCSDENIRNNIRSGRDWCNTGDLCMSRYTGKFTRSEYIEASKTLIKCHECQLMVRWMACAGTINHGKRAGTPIRMDKTAPDKLAVLTTRLPGSREEERIIFAVFIIHTAFDGDENEEGFVTSDPDCRIELKPDEAKRLLFWNYHSNAGNPESIKWGTGLYRYLDNIEALQILRDIVSVKEGKEDHSHALDVMNAFIERNRLGNIEIPDNSGPLAR